MSKVVSFPNSLSSASMRAKLSLATSPKSISSNPLLVDLNSEKSANFSSKVHVLSNEPLIEVDLPLRAPWSNDISSRFSSLGGLLDEDAMLEPKMSSRGVNGAAAGSPTHFI